jgi:hypothetical protein
MILTCCTVLGVPAFATPAEPETPSVPAESAVSTESVPAPALPDLGQPLASFTEITCQFNCEDGSGFGLDPCPDDTLGECCAYAAPACANHGGLESGICTKGRLGLPCQPI